MKWISVKDKLPNKDCEVLGYDGRYMACLSFKSDLKQFFSDEHFYSETTHWMRLPKAPITAPELVDSQESPSENHSPY
jgi:uncharacterized protein DUF551